MFDAPRLRPAGLLAALASIVALSCGSDIIDLLPPVAGATHGAGTAGTAGANVGGTASGGAGNVIPGGGGSNAGSPTANGGTPVVIGQAGRNGNGCPGPGCNEGGNASFGGAFSFPCDLNGMGTCTACVKDSQCPTDRYCVHNICLECSNDQQCDPGFSCDRVIGHCSPSCQNTLDCRDQRVCDPTQGACVHCTPNGHECPDGDDPEARICYFRRCVECLGDPDCMRDDRPYCVDYRCVECLRDLDCNGEGGKVHCDRGSGRCQPQ